jgi:hypothetical protein
VQWAEQFGLGELGLMPEQFWALTVREFWIKFEAFARSESRAEAALIRQALRLGNYKKGDRAAMTRDATALRRYPVKPWLESP